MPRIASAHLTISQLEQLLTGRRAELARLERMRSKMARKLSQLESRIVSLGGSARGGGAGRNGRGRARNEKSLNAVIQTVLGRSSKPMGVGDIADAVRSAGYRTNSANFRGIVNQMLIKDKRFTSASRGMYQMKK